MQRKISEVMVKSPHTVNVEVSLRTAMDMMTKHRIRHLPVLEAGKIVGLLSERDIHLCASFSELEDVQVEEAMAEDPYVVGPDASLTEVVGQMSRHKYGAVVVAKGPEALGIFTSVDAMVVLAELLSKKG